MRVCFSFANMFIMKYGVFFLCVRKKAGRVRKEKKNISRVSHMLIFSHCFPFWHNTEANSNLYHS